MDESLTSDIEIYQVDSVQMLDSAMDESLSSDIEIYQVDSVQTLHSAMDEFLQGSKLRLPDRQCD